MRTERPIYLHFLDLYTYARATQEGRASDEVLVVEARRAFRLAALIADRLFLPASSYFEGKLAQLVLGDHVELSQMGVLWLSASQESLEAHREGKLPQYSRASPSDLFEAYTKPTDVTPPPYMQKVGSSRDQISQRWAHVLEGDELPSLLKNECEPTKVDAVERAWARVPGMLEHRAFVPAHVRQLLARQRVDISVRTLSGVIEPAYVAGYAKSLQAGIVGELVYLDSPFDLPAQEVMRYRPTLRAFSYLDLLPLLDGASVHELLRFKGSSEWGQLWPLIRARNPVDASLRELAQQAAVVARGRHRFPRYGYTDCNIGVVTALPEEFAAFREMLTNPLTRKPPGDPNAYAVGAVPAVRDGDEIGEHLVVLTQLKRMGTLSAASAATNLMRSFPSVRLVLMVGIACGIPSPTDPGNHVRLGDIIVSDRQGVVAFTSGVQLEVGFDQRHLLQPPSAALLGAVNALEADELRGERPWEEHIAALAERSTVFKRPGPQSDILKDSEGKRVKHPRDDRRRGGQPRVFRGNIGSSDILSRDAAFRDDIAKKHKLRGIEMEGSGIAEATWTFNLPYGVVRGSSDYGDRDKQDQWHHYAAAVAAGYARALIERIAPEDLRLPDDEYAEAPLETGGEALPRSGIADVESGVSREGRENGKSI